MKHKISRDMFLFYENIGEVSSLTKMKTMSEKVVAKMASRKAGANKPIRRRSWNYFMRRSEIKWLGWPDGGQT